jgi:hypothetical protein
MRAEIQARTGHSITQRRRREQHVARVITDVAGRADPVAKQLRLVICSARIGETVAAFEPDDQLPELTRLRRPRGAIPGESDPWRNAAPRLGNVEQELRISQRRLRKRGHVTAHQQVLSFQSRRQIACDAACGAQPRPGQARKQSRDQLESPDERQRGRSDQQTDGSMPVRQSRKAVNAASSHQKCQGNSPHPDLPV